MPNIDELEREVEDVLRTVDQVLGKANGNGDDDDDPEDDQSGDDNGDDNGDEEDDDNNGVSKASHDYEFLTSNDEDNRPGGLSSSTHPSSSNSRHKFEALTLKIANEEGVPKSAAMAMARMKFPDVFRDYQLNQRPKGDSYRKSAPATYEELVAVEMAKGCSEKIAGQRVMNLHGNVPRHTNNLAKVASDVQHTFQEAAAEIYNRGDCVSGTEALRKCRLENPALYKALQSV